MPNKLGRDNVLTDELWGEIDKAVTWEVGQIRVAQKVFRASHQCDGRPICADRFDLETMTLTEVDTKPYVEISVEFSLPLDVVDREPMCGDVRILARLAAKSLAVAEDKLFFQGAETTLEPIVKVINRSSVGDGLLELAEPKTVEVKPLHAGNGKTYGANTLAAVATGLALLNDDAQPGPYALILESALYADTYVPLGPDAVTAADRLTHLLAAGVYPSGAMPPSTGLLASVGGEPTSMYVEQDAITAHTLNDTSMNAHFSVFERVQLNARDPRAFVKLRFQ